MMPVIPALERNPIFLEMPMLVPAVKNTDIISDNITTFYALIVGCTTYEVSRYNIPKIHPFDECTMRYVYDVLVNASNWKKENIILLLNEQATKESIISSLHELCEKIDKDDIFLFSWMGHGTQIPDDDYDEPDGFDEAICPYDTVRDHDVLSNIITDDELDDLLSFVRAKGQLIMFESCMSGGMVEHAKTSDIRIVDVECDGRIVIMSTPDGKLGYGLYPIGWPMSFLYAMVLSDEHSDMDADGWISAQEAFCKLDERYDTFENESFHEFICLFYQKFGTFIMPYELLISYCFLSVFKMDFIPKLILSSLYSLIAYCIYHTQMFEDFFLIYTFNMMKSEYEMIGADNDPNMLDGFMMDLPIIRLHS